MGPLTIHVIFLSPGFIEINHFLSRLPSLPDQMRGANVEHDKRYRTPTHSLCAVSAPVLCPVHNTMKIHQRSALIISRLLRLKKTHTYLKQEPIKGGRKNSLTH